MKKLSMLLLVVLIASCMVVPENGNSIKGKWALSSLTVKILRGYETGYETDVINFYPGFDNYYSSPVMEVNDEMLALYMNLTSSPIFGMVGMGSDIIVSEDSLYLSVVGVELLSSLLPTDTFGVAYDLSSDGELSLLYQIMDDHLDIPGLSIEAKFEEYIGSLPRDSWLNYMEKDSYEIDSVTVDTTTITLDARQSHSLSYHDRDIFEFSAKKDSTYNFHVMSNMEAIAALYDSLGHKLRYSKSVDSLEVMESTENQLLRLKANYTGKYYIAVDGEIGYYDIVVKKMDESIILSKQISLLKEVDEKEITRKTIESYLIEMMEEK